MSIERELLKKVISGDNKGDFFISYDLYKEIYEFLVHHEQPEQEHVGIVRTIGGYPDNSEHVVDWVCKYKDLKEGDRLYLAPQKREPLSDEEVRAKYRDIALDNPLYVPSYYAGFRDAERAHGIGGGE